LPLSYRDNDSNGGIFFAIKDNWKKLRVTLNGSFSQSKLKQVFISTQLKCHFYFFQILILNLKAAPMVSKSLDRMIDGLNKKVLKEFVISE